ncbi:MAG TPA: DUF308 domain-containing protein [Acidimicrobiia bacterium]|nr:DUF308 domain-containing protein [Acidimicrobiia bacterium]
MTMTFVVDEDEVAKAYADKWWLFLVSGILWLLLGFVVLSLRPVSISVCVILIAVAFWLGAMTLFALAMVTSGGWRVLTIVAGILAIAAGVAAIVWPGPTIVVISIFVAWYLLIRGIFDVAISLSHTHVHGWWMMLIAGIIGIGLGAWAVGNPDRSVLLLVSIIGIWSIFKGAADLVAAFSYRSMKKELAAA